MSNEVVLVFILILVVDLSLFKLFFVLATLSLGLLEIMVAWPLFDNHMLLLVQVAYL